ncbi:MAG: ABC transporter permease, partial [Proteobacteria bacterium]|nr:ABC transporter permease [Pseudomonadota bacterium]
MSELKENVKSREIPEGRRMWTAFLRNRTALAGGVIAVLIVLVGIFAPWIAPHDPLAQDSYIRLADRSVKHWLGTDDFGRDVLSRIIWGTRISLIIGVASVVAGLIVGTLMGMMAGFLRGRTETVIMRFTDVIMCFPDLILAIAVTAALGSNLINLILTIALVMTPRFARLSHSLVLSLRERD